MREMGLSALALIAAMPLAAQDTPAEDRHEVAPGNNWTITDSDCAIDANWGDVAILLTRHDDHHDLGVYNAKFKKVANDKIIPVRFGAGDVMIDHRDYYALGRKDKEATSYVSDVDDALLDQVAKANAFRFYRNDAILVDLDMTGFAEALTTMRACEAVHPQAPDNAAEATDASQDAGSATAPATAPHE